MCLLPASTSLSPAVDNLLKHIVNNEISNFDESCEKGDTGAGGDPSRSQGRAPEHGCEMVTLCPMDVGLLGVGEGSGPVWSSW